MDRLDIRILRELFQGQTIWPARPGLLASYRQVARSLGASPGTVRNRIQRWIRSGFLQGHAVYVNPKLLGLLSGSYAIEVSPALRKRDVIEALGELDGVVFFENFRGNLLGLGVTYRDEASLAVLLDRVDQIARSERGVFSRVQHPPLAIVLTRPEWALISRLMSGDFQTYPQLARELRISVRTLKRRAARLARSGAVLSYPRIDYRALEGGVTAELLLSFASPDTRPSAERTVRERLDDWSIFAGVWEEFDIFRLILPNVTIASELAEEVGRIEGVRFARLEFVDGLIDRFEKLRSHLDVVLAQPRPPSKLIEAA
ncbi:MAG TPA: hypothetical protein VGV89_07865 [Thermoplasmata archaeon]|nr:hypothetical protein [Thermoplasmata archaeon]